MGHIFHSFTRAAQHIEPIFRQAAGYLQMDKVKFHGKAIIGLPGAKYHTMVGQVEGSALVRRARAAGRALRDQILGRPDYYASFEKYNNFTM
jgi:hypothetical protein